MDSELKLTSIGISYLNQVRKWTYFLSIRLYLHWNYCTWSAFFK